MLTLAEIRERRDARLKEAVRLKSSGLTNEWIGQKLAVSRERVRQMLSEASKRGIDARTGR
jgi:orotate phosphoribosyltransferase-like protein